MKHNLIMERHGLLGIRSFTMLISQLPDARDARQRFVAQKKWN
jgi:hypothetical protein